MQAGLQRWLGDLIKVEALEVTSEEATLRILIQYVVQGTGERRTETFVRSGVS